jgi:AAA family ATP:ADP antiporter
MIGVTGAAFFGLQLFGPTFAPVAAALGTTPLMLSVLVGAAQNILSKSSKYSLFDPCKEMAYIPLDQESKTKGKAAVDVIGNPLGKSGGSLIQQLLIFGVGSLAAATPYLAVILIGIIFTWYKAANSLATQFEAATED